MPDQVDDNKYMENSLDSDWILLSMEDGPDNVDLSSLTGMSAIVYAGSGNDTLATGGTRPLLDVLGFPYVGSDPPSTVEMYGEEGDDTFHMNKWFDVQDWVVDGGPGNDRLLFTGTESDDIIVLVAGPNGTLEKVILKAPSPNPGQTANEVMKIQYPAGMNPTGGSFRLTFDNDVAPPSTTGPVPYNATAAQVQTALNAIPSIQGAGGSVSVERLPAGPWTRDSYWMVEFQGGLGNTDLRTMVADGGPVGFELEWTPDKVSVEETVQGYSQSVYRVTLPDNCVGGVFQLVVDGVPTGDIAYDASEDDVHDALAALPGFGDDDVSVMAFGDGGPWDVRFESSDRVTLVAGTSGLERSVTPQLATTREAEPGDNQIQRISLPSDAASGTFTLAFHPTASGPWRHTDPLPADAYAIEVQNALELIPTIGPGNVSVTGPVGGPYDVEFIADLRETTFPLIDLDDTDLTGSFSVFVTTFWDGTSTSDELQVVQTGGVVGGTFTLEFTNPGGATSTTGDIPYDATATQVRNALNAIPSISSGGGSVSVSLTVVGSDRAWSVDFDGGVLGNTDVNELIVDRSNLVGGAVTGSSSVVETQPASAGTNELQKIDFDPQPTSGTFALTFNGARSGPLPHDATVAQVQAALDALPTIHNEGGIVTVSPDLDPDPDTRGLWIVEFGGSFRAQDQPGVGVDAGDLLATGDPPEVEAVQQNVSINEVQTVELPGTAVSGSFTLTFDDGTVSDTTDPIDYDATALEVETELELLTNISDVTVTGNDGGPWEIEFVGDMGGTDQPLLTSDASSLMLQGGIMQVDEEVKGGNGIDIVIATTDFESLTDVERFVIEGGGGDDRLIIEGAPNFSQGVFFDGGDGMDTMELGSKHASPTFVAPIFPDDTQGTITMDATDFQFADVEGGIVFDAGNSPGAVSLAGTDAGDEIRFAGVEGSTGEATFARDGQVTISLMGFGDGSSVILRGEQGDDTISVAVNGVTEFSRYTVRGGGPAGADALRMEGTTLGDDFTYSPGAFHFLPGTPAAEDGTLSVGGTTAVHLDLLGFEDYSFVGLGGTDSLTVTSPTDASKDSIRFFPETGNDGSFLFMLQSGVGPETTVTYSPVRFESFESRNFNSRGGTDTLYISTDNVPGVNNGMVDVDGGNGVATLNLGDQATLFTHEFTQDPDTHDLLIVDVAATQDETVTGVAPGVGLDITLSISAGQDVMTFMARDADVTVNLDDITISQPGYGDVTFFGTEDVGLVGDHNVHTLTFDGPSSRERFVYTPLAHDAGGLEIDGAWAGYGFEGFHGAFVINGGADVGDAVVVQGSHSNDSIFVDGLTRTVSVTNAVPMLLKPVTLGADVEVAGVDGLSGDDNFLVVPDPRVPGEALLVEVYGNWPNASDRLVVRDEGPGDVVRHHQGPDQRSGTIIVGPSGPVAYQAIERVDILPINPLTGGTGSDYGGQIVVFHADQFEQNDSFLNTTDLTDLAESTYRPNIDPGGLTNPFGQDFNVPGDEDWYRFRAPKIGSYRLEVLFDPIAGLPGGGDLDIELYDADSALVVSGSPWTSGNLFGEEVTFEVDNDQEVYLRVKGATVESINVYDVELVEVDLVGPRVTNVAITGEPDFNLFNGKPSASGAGPEGPRPTPLVHSITISLEDLIVRPPGAQGFVYPTLDMATAQAVGHYRVVGDANGVIPIREVIATNDPPLVGTIPTGTIELIFFEPLPDDRITLTISELVLDPAENQLDGESNTIEPHDFPTFPSGDNRAGGDFVARFTVDSRAEIGTWSAGSAYVDTNGNFLFDPQNTDFTNRDIVYTLGFTSDDVFAGNFQSPIAQEPADGFDKLAAYGNVGGVYRWLVDTTNDGVPNLVTTQGTNAAFNGLPVAGDFDGDATNGDEVALFTGTNWLFDTDRDFVAETSAASAETGLPIVGDFDGDGFEDLGLWRDDQFFLSLSTQGGGVPEALGGTATITTTFNFGFIGVRERPVAADMDGDGIDDLGLWVPDRSGATSEEGGEWYFLISDYRSIVERLVPADPRDPTGPQTVEFTPVPFGEDRYAQWGDEYAIPVVGNFDPPVTGAEVEPGPGLVNLAGTAGDDTFQLMPGPTPGSWIVTLNGAAQSIEADTLTVTLDGRGGSDTFTMIAPGGDDVARLWPGRGTVIGEGYSVAVSNVETVAVDGGGGADLAFLRDNPDGKDTLTAGPNAATFAGDGYSNQVTSFRWVHVYGTAGHADAALLHGQPGVRDKFEAWPDRAKLAGDDYLVRTNQISYVAVDGQPGDADVALLHDDPNTADTFEGGPDQAVLSGDAFSVQVNSFPYVHAYATADGDDVATFHDDPARFDRLRARPGDAKLWGEFFFLHAKSFQYVYANSTPGTGDQALLYDSLTDDTFTAWPDRAELSGDTFFAQVNSFRWVHAHSTAGADAATFHGSDARDVFVANHRMSKMRGDGFYNRAVSFERVEAYGGGGRDVAVLRDAVLESGVTEPLDTLQLAWLYEFERIRQRSDSGQSVVDATDQIFTAYWE